MPVVHVQVSTRGLKKNAGDSLFIPQVTYKGLKLLEKHLEDFIVEHPDLLFPEEEETFHIIATHVTNDLGDKADIVGLLATGELVVVEVKRDKSDMRNRAEPVEWQAFRYAATMATIKTPLQLVPLFSGHIERHKALYGNPANSSIRAKELLDEYLEDLDPEVEFNDHQHVILVASDFDERTLAACSWLILNDVPLECIRISPHSISKTEVILDVARVLPLPTIEDLLPGLKTVEEPKARTRAYGTRGPRIPELLEAGLLCVGDELFVKSAPSRTALLVDGETVEFEKRKLSPTKWGLEVTGWPTFSVYESAYVKRTGEKLKALRKLLPRSAAGATSTTATGRDGVPPS